MDRRTRSLERRNARSTKDFASLDAKFALHKLPSELIHLIHKYLGPTDVAKLRLVSQKVAQIGLEYLVPSINLQLTTTSYNRLTDISRHPVISKHVCEIRYESDFLEHISWEEFKRFRETGRESATSIHDGRSRGPSTSAQSKLEERHEQPEMEKIQAAYRLYQDFLKHQSELKRIAFLSSQVTEALLRLPSLIRLDTGALWNHDRFLLSLDVIFGRAIQNRVKTPEGGWYWPWGRSYRGMDLGLSAPITATLLYGLGRADSNIKQIVVPHLYWRFLWQTDKVFAVIKNALCKVHRMKAGMNGPMLRRARLSEIEHQEFEECLTQKKPFEFLTCCHDLTHLDLAWYDGFFDGKLDLQHFLGDFTWHILSSVRFGRFRITEAAFVDFAARHSTSLDQLSLWDITLSEGHWYSTFKKLRSLLRLRKASVSGIFYHNGYDAWWMDSDPKWNGHQPYGDYVREYLVDHSDQEMQLDVLVREGHV